MAAHVLVTMSEPSHHDQDRQGQGHDDYEIVASHEQYPPAISSYCLLSGNDGARCDRRTPLESSPPVPAGFAI